MNEAVDPGPAPTSGYPPGTPAAQQYVLRRISAAPRPVTESCFPTLEDALAALRDCEAACLADGAGPQEIAPWEIYRRPVGKVVPVAGRPHHEFRANARAVGSGGDGSESSPWWGLATAAEQLADLHHKGRIDFSDGQVVRLTHREVFTATALERRKKIKEVIAQSIFMMTTLLLVAPMLAIFAYVFVQAWPALSLSFILENPKNYMTAGGIWAPLVGTFCLVLISLLVAAPIGVLAGVYLNEYARDNWLTRIINLAVVNLAGVPSIVHALFGVGAFVMFAGMGRSLLAASCTLAVMTLPVIITSTREALASVPMAFREACWNLARRAGKPSARSCCRIRSAAFLRA